MCFVFMFSSAAWMLSISAENYTVNAAVAWYEMFVLLGDTTFWCDG
jgi:hypothetical protein